MLSARIVQVLVLAAVLTVWELAFKPMYTNWVLSQGGVMGLGETFVGYAIIGLTGLLIVEIILRRLRRPE